jgi:subtilase family serine protease
MSCTTNTKVAATQLRSILFTLFACLSFVSYSRMLEAQIVTSTLSRRVSQAVAGSRVVARLLRSQRLTLALGLPLRNQDELDSLIGDLANPASPNFHQYLTPDQFSARFGPTGADYQALLQFAQQNNLPRPSQASPRIRRPLPQHLSPSPRKMGSRVPSL